METSNNYQISEKLGRYNLECFDNFYRINDLTLDSLTILTEEEKNHIRNNSPKQYLIRKL